MAESGVGGGVGVSDEKVGCRKKGPVVVPGVKGIIMQTMGKGMGGWGLWKKETKIQMRKVLLQQGEDE